MASDALARTARTMYPHLSSSFGYTNQSKSLGFYQVLEVLKNSIWSIKSERVSKFNFSCSIQQFYLPNDIIETRAKSTTGDNSSLYILRFKIYLFTWASTVHPGEDNFWLHK
uniref:Uncharacterized protein n=1 Tax=Oryza meridionalis TaxID=40149 RepID=A0A0E0EXK7_9ORYZ